MKKFILNVAGLLLVTATIAQTGINEEERKKALNHLKETENRLISITKNLTSEQLNFKTDENSWSIAECMEHIAISEKNIMDMIHMSLEDAADPSKRSKVTMSDEQVLGIITSREQKVKTREAFEPTNSFGNYSETFKTFRVRRKLNMKFVKSSDADLRNHYLQFPFGLIDTYQGVLFMSGHTQRHTDQIKEIMETDGFPG